MATIVQIAPNRTAIEAELAALDAKEATLLERHAAIEADRSAREDAAARALLVGDDGGKAAAKLAAIEQETAIIDRALAILAGRRDELRKSLGLAELRDTVDEWVAVEREIAKRQAKVRELFRPVVEYESLGYDFPTLDRGPIVLLRARFTALRHSAEFHAAELGADLGGLLAEARARQGEEGP